MLASALVLLSCSWHIANGTVWGAVLSACMVLAGCKFAGVMGFWAAVGMAIGHLAVPTHTLAVFAVEVANCVVRNVGCGAFMAVADCLLAGIVGLGAVGRMAGG